MPTLCGGAPDDQVCANPNVPGTMPFCCSGECLPGNDYDPKNCGACGQRCEGGTVCQHYTCVPANPCNAGDDLAVCALPDGTAGRCCGGICADVTSDPNNCYTCGSVCPSGAACNGGNCSTPCDAGGCPVGTACFYGICVPSACGPGSDGIYCGDSDGHCCGGNCIDVSSDPQNCGGCGNACLDGQACLYYECGSVASCEANGDACSDDGGRLGICCGAQCVGLYSTDRDNCGACGLGCAVGASCLVMYAAGNDTRCANGAGYDSTCSHDGDCPAGRVCVLGVCATPSCDAGTSSCTLQVNGSAVVGTCCGSSCVDTAGDSANCLGCGNTCAPGLTCQGASGCLDPSGSAGCGPEFPCPSGSQCYGGQYCASTRCGPGSEGQLCSNNSPLFGICCGGSCVDTLSDPENCELCGLSVLPDRCVYYHHRAVTQNCLQTCGPGTACANATCVDSICQTSQAYCLSQDGTIGNCCISSHACANLENDPWNCGACGIACPPGATCQNGLCNGLAACGPGHANLYCDLDAGLSFLCCPGLGCIDTSYDPQNCGACNAACAAGQNCNAGTCVTGS